jgi:hypothetical protein
MRFELGWQTDSERDNFTSLFGLQSAPLFAGANSSPRRSDFHRQTTRLFESKIDCKIGAIFSAMDAGMLDAQ